MLYHQQNRNRERSVCYDRSRSEIDTTTKKFTENLYHFVKFLLGGVNEQKYFYFERRRIIGQQKLQENQVSFSLGLTLNVTSIWSIIRLIFFTFKFLLALVLLIYLFLFKFTSDNPWIEYRTPNNSNYGTTPFD